MVVLGYEAERAQAWAAIDKQVTGTAAAIPWLWDKTTGIESIMGLLPVRSGAVRFKDRELIGLTPFAIARLGIGYLSQEPSIFRKLTVEENILAVLETVEPDKAERQLQLDALLEEFRITRLRTSPAIRLSGGERRRVEIARALASRPSFMLLDEPFAGIDPIAVNDIRALVRHLTQRGIGVLITDHNVRETLDLVGRAYIIHDGMVLTHGTADTEDLPARTQTFYDEARALGIPAELHFCEGSGHTAPAGMPVVVCKEAFGGWVRDFFSRTLT